MKKLDIKHTPTAYNLDKYNDEMTLMTRMYADYAYQYATNHDEFLELGLGHGLTLGFLKVKFKHITVIDADDALIKRYSASFPNVQFIHSYFEEFKPDFKYSNIGLSFILEIVNDPIEILKHYANLLEDDGKLFVVVGNSASLHRMIAYNANIISDMSMITEKLQSYGIQRNYSHNEWMDLFNRSGFKCCATHGLYLKPLTTEQLDSLNLGENVYQSLAITAKDLPEISNAIFYVLGRP